MATVMVRKANVILDIPDDEATISKYLSNGYNLVDKFGKVVKTATHGVGEDLLRVELEAVKKQNAQLVKENEDLKAKLEALVAAQEETEQEEPEPKVPVVSEEPKAPKKKKVRASRG